MPHFVAQGSDREHRARCGHAELVHKSQPGGGLPINQLVRAYPSEFPVGLPDFVCRGIELHTEYGVQRVGLLQLHAEACGGGTMIAAP